MVQKPRSPTTATARWCSAANLALSATRNVLVKQMSKHYVAVLRMYRDALYLHHALLFWHRILYSERSLHPQGADHTPLSSHSLSIRKAVSGCAHNVPYCRSCFSSSRFIAWLTQQLFSAQVAITLSSLLSLHLMGLHAHTVPPDIPSLQQLLPPSGLM